MKAARITITIPGYVFKNLSTIVSSGNVSHYVTEALEEKLIKEKLKKVDPVEEFFAAIGQLPEREISSIIGAIEKGRK